MIIVRLTGWKQRQLQNRKQRNRFQLIMLAAAASSVRLGKDIKSLLGSARERPSVLRVDQIGGAQLTPLQPTAFAG
jgi:hypothetical protein